MVEAGEGGGGRAELIGRFAQGLGAIECHASPLNNIIIIIIMGLESVSVSEDVIGDLKNRWKRGGERGGAVPLAWTCVL